MRYNIYEKILKEYCDGLISVQYTGEDKAFQGGFWCRACKMIHGRSPDAVYPLAVMYKRTGERKYLDAAMMAFEYGETMLCSDGSLYNDSQANWRYTTVFQAISVFETLHSIGNLLSKVEKERMLERAKGMAEWLYCNLDETSRPNINYCATNSLALQYAGMFFNEEKYLRQAKHLAQYAYRHFTENGLFYGESKNHDAYSPLKCRSVDIGYDLEESIPALVKYARLAKDEEALSYLAEKLLQMTDFILPDGGLDNSFGCRNNKWTYWGSRTSDGCSPAYLILADKNPIFAEVAYRNTELLDKCSKDGFLYGGPHYERHGEYPCVHHTFEHANALAFVVEEIEEKYLVPDKRELPVEKDWFKFYPEINTYKFARGNYNATITGYDFDLPFSGHASGGTLTMLYGKNVGPMIAGSVTDYVLVEPTNMQQVLDVKKHRSLVPRLIKAENENYSSSNYTHMRMWDKVEKDAVEVFVKTGLSTKEDCCLDCSIDIQYRLNEDGLSMSVLNAKGTKFLLPLIAGKVEVQKGTVEKEEEIFFLTGGFIANEITILPNENGEITFRIFE